MMHLVTRSLLVPVSVLALVCASACAEDSKDRGDDDDSTGGTSGTAGTGGAATGEYLIIPDSSGWVDRASNTIGIQGAWYPYGDQYGVPGKCVGFGMHPAEDCSVINSPEPPPFNTPVSEWTGTFNNVNGEMCTSGATAVIKMCADGITTEGCPANDFANMWGAGIGLDLNADKGEEGGMKHPWPVPPGVIGFSFVINAVPQTTKLRVEIPVLLTDAEATAVGLPSGSTSDDHPKGAPYWITVGTPTSYPPSAVVDGYNKVLFSEIKHPTGAIDVSTLTQRILGVQFHTPAMPAAATAKGDFNYCVKELKFITQ